MPRFESPVSSNTLTYHSCSHSKSMLLESYVLEASEPPQPTATTTGTASRDHDSEPTPTAGTTTTTHFLIHMHFSHNTTPNYPSHQTIHYSHTPLSRISIIRIPRCPRGATVPPSLLLFHYLLLINDNPPINQGHQPPRPPPKPSPLPTPKRPPLPRTTATTTTTTRMTTTTTLSVLMLDEHAVRDIPIGDFLPPAPYIPSEAEAEDLDVKTVAQQGGYAVCRFFNTREEEEANIVYARSVGIGRGRRGREG